VACALLVAACALGVSAGLLASAVPARAASTSQARGRAHCRPGPPEPVPGVIPAMSRAQVIIWEAGHGRSC
jgi:anti-sigma factor RsiW